MQHTLNIFLAGALFGAVPSIVRFFRNVWTGNISSEPEGGTQ